MTKILISISNLLKEGLVYNEEQRASFLRIMEAIEKESSRTGKKKVVSEKLLSDKMEFKREQMSSGTFRVLAKPNLEYPMYEYHQHLVSALLSMYFDFMQLKIEHDKRDESLFYEQECNEVKKFLDSKFFEYVLKSCYSSTPN